METRAHHILIGLFTVLIVMAGLGFGVWLAKAHSDQEWNYYDIVFNEAVTGLSKGGAVQYNGIRLGDVMQLRLDPEDPRRVLARVRVSGDTPLHKDTHAKLALTGVTGDHRRPLAAGPSARKRRGPDHQYQPGRRACERSPV
jgi:phospholipid/cholesterol/gamma-HCH transport system substrate-binding protein